LLALASLVIAMVAAAPRAATAAPYVPHQLLLSRLAPDGTSTAPVIVHLPRSMDVLSAAMELRRRPGVAYAVPNYVAHVDWLPDDRGRSGRLAGWEAMQWNFMPNVGVNAPQAWSNLIADARPGGRGVVVAVLDTGVAYRDWRQYRKSPDFTGTRFVDPYDFVANNRYPLDREGHGTFVAGTIAEATNNGFALTGLAYGASIMPVRVLDQDGTGDSGTIARGIRYAVRHHAQIINLSLEFSLDVTSGDIPDIIAAIRYAHSHGVSVVAAAGNEGVDQLAYPARAFPAISVGATTADRCLADYSNGGTGLDVVAPGGGNDSSLAGDADCHPDRQLPTIRQLTFLDPSDPDRFGYPDQVYGTSMATPHVSATLALILASGVLGRHPTPEQLLRRLEQTAQHLGATTPNRDYGYGLIDAGAATSKAIPVAPPPATRSDRRR
jgi:serine protease